MANPDLKTPPPEKTAARHKLDWSLPLAIAGTFTGAAIGALTFSWLLKQGLYAVMLPGVLAGLGGGYPLKRRSIAMGVFAAAISMITMILAEWYHHPFIKDESLAFFLEHLHHVSRGRLLIMVLGAVVAFWFGMGRDERT